SLAGSERAISQAMIDPKLPPGSPTAIDSLEHQVKNLRACAIKCYTGSGSWWLDDEAVAYPMLEEAERLGLRVINVHKGFPQLLGPMASTYVQSRDLPKVAEDWPRMRFVAYHSGYFPGQGITEFLNVVRSMRSGARRRIYAEIGSAFAVAFTEGPDAAAHLLGSLLKELGSNRILWGTDSIWWGSPQWQIDAFKALTIPESMQEQFGYPPLTETAKRRILGLNAAHLYRGHPRRKRCEISQDQLAKIQKEQGGIRKSRTHLVYGPQTQEDYIALLAAHKGGVSA
ncbi:MAG: amidohydrolase family protein, partial [Vicinamibacteria bacterium]